MAAPYRLRGIPFVDVTPRITTGNIFWVDSGIGVNDTAHGGDPDTPVATIDYAIGLCTASNGDVIYVAPGHTESINATTALFLCDVAGVSIIGLGNAANRPLITVGTATTAEVNITAQNVLLKNLQFTSAIDSLGNFVNVAANHTTIEDCFFYTADTYEAVCFINLVTTYDYLTVRGCRFVQPTDPGGTDAAAGTGCFYLVDSEYVTIENCQMVGQFETAMFHNKTTAAGQLWIKDCYGYSSLATSQIGLLVEGATGGAIGGLYINPAGTDVTTAQLWGVESTTFFIASYFGNDSGGGQGAVFVTAAT